MLIYDQYRPYLELILYNQLSYIVPLFVGLMSIFGVLA